MLAVALMLSLLRHGAADACSIDTGMLLRTEGLPGPVIMKKLGNPALATPRYVFGPSAHFSFSARSSRPRMSILKNGPVIASNPVAKTMMSRS